MDQMITSVSSSSVIKIHIAVLFLAAGLGSRLGSHPKALLRKNGRTLLEEFAITIEQFSPIEFIAITGFHAKLIEEKVKLINQNLEYSIKVFRNPAPQDGQGSSVRLGLELLESNFDALLIALSDQPEISAVEIRELINAFSQRKSGEEVILPIVNGQRGNPVLFSKKAIEEILSHPGLVCRTYMDAHPEKVGLMESTSNAFVQDIDTPIDLHLSKFTF